MRVAVPVVLFASLFTACDSAPTPAADAARSDIAADVSPADVPAVDIPAPDVPPVYEAFNPNPRGSFPPGFLWGSATAPYQIEGGLERTDWGAWERMNNRIAGGAHANDGPQSYTRFEADLDALVATGQNAYRLGIDWSRLFPSRSAWMACRDARAMPLPAFTAACRTAASADGIAYYHRVLDAMAARRLTPMVTLHHFVFPEYINDLSMPAGTQGFANDAVREDFYAFARYVGSEYGRKVDYWITINEPFAYVAGGYLQQSFPPGVALDFDLVLRVVRNMIYAHARAYDALHEADTFSASTTDAGMASPAMVSIASHNRVFRPLRSDNDDDLAAARIQQFINNRLFLDAIVRGNLDANANASLADPGDLTNDPALRARADFIGLNYYGITLVRGLRSLPLIRGLPQITSLPTDLPKNDLDWDIYPQGIREVLHEVNAYGLPIIITENGTADDAGTNRPRFIAEHLAAIAAAIRAGDRVTGYFHWSIIDNFEWAEGFCPRFGLYRVEYSNPARPRVPTMGAATLRQIIMENQVSDTLLNGTPRYSPPRLCHPRPDAGT